IPAWDIAPTLEINFYHQSSLQNRRFSYMWLFDWEIDPDPCEDVVVKMSFNSWSDISNYMKMSVDTGTASIADLTALFDDISDPYEFEDLLYACTLLSSVDPINSSSYQTLSESLKALKCILTKFLQFPHLKHGFTPKATWIRFKPKPSSHRNSYQSFPRRISYLWYGFDCELKEELLKIKEMNIEQLSLYIKTIHDKKTKPSHWNKLRPLCEQFTEKRKISVQQISALTTVEEEGKKLLLKQLKELWDVSVSDSSKPFSIFGHEKQNVRHPTEKKKQKLPKNKNLALVHRTY
ncbi:unnamed protein product, partial [Didymodactylos carnosus]